MMSDEFSGFAHKIKEDLVNKNLLFLGTEFGLFITTLDGGAKMDPHEKQYSLESDGGDIYSSGYQWSDRQQPMGGVSWS